MSKQTPPPGHLTRKSKALWRSICEAYVLEDHQKALLQRALEASDRADEARDLLSAEGLTFTDRYGQLRAHPAVAIERDARTAQARLLRELNLEPLPAESRPPR